MTTRKTEKSLIAERDRAISERDAAVTRAHHHNFLQRQVRDLKDMLEEARKAERKWEGPFLKKIEELDDELIALKSERDELKLERDAIMKLAIRRREAMMTAESERDHASAGWKNAMVERDALKKERDILLANLQRVFG